MVKNWLQAVLLILSCCFLNIVLAGTVPVFNAPTPKQSYHVVGMEGHDVTTQTTSSQSTLSQPAAATDPVSVKPTASAVSQLTQESLSYQQKVNQEIQYLASKNNKIAGQLAGLTQMISLLSQQVTQLHAVQSKLIAKTAKQTSMTQSSSVMWEEWVHWLESIGTVAYINFGGAALILVFLGFLIGRPRPHRHAAKATRASVAETATPVVGDNAIMSETIGEDDTRGEYNFMATNEAIPAMLDLARSYMAMGDHEQVRSVLEKVVERGDKEQQAEAQSILDEIDQKPR